MKSFKNLFCTIVILVLVCVATTKSYAKTVNFAVASDVHYNYASDSQNKKSSDSVKALRGFVDRINENNYDFVVFLGDNIDKSKPDQLKSFLHLVKDIKIPYYLVMGNRDVHKISGMSKEEYLAIVSKNNKYQRKAKNSYYFYPTSDIIAIVLDGVSSGMPSNHGVFNEKTLKWLDSVLTKNKNKKAIIFQHVPYMEPYDNPTHNILDKNEYAAVIRSHENILMICSGHYHKEYVNKDEKNVYHISVPGLFQAPYYYYEMQIKYKKLPLLKAKDFKIDGTAKPAI